MLVSLLGTAGIALPYPVLSPFFLDPDNSNALTQFLGLLGEIANKSRRAACIDQGQGHTQFYRHVGSSG